MRYNTLYLPSALRMPPKSTLIDKAIVCLTRSPFVCRSCLSKKASSRKWSSQTLLSRTQHRRPHPQLRIPPPARKQASTIASVTAVNAKREIPPAFQALYGALSELETEAGVYLNLSQLRLALRGLESDNAVTRVASVSSSYCLFLYKPS